MSIPDALSMPVFTYVGRLRDSRKGLELFLDALAILWDTNLHHRFKAWVIGGSDHDRVWAINSAAARPILRSRISAGDLTFWGRIDNSALPEFYSRSTALIVPSFREQFGIAAVEAMMCGCPVIAARVGGLQDVVVEGRTGNLFERGMSTSLVAVMISYLKAPLLPRWLGTNAANWARRVFDSNFVHACLENLLKDPATYDCRRWLGPSDRLFQNFAIQDIIPRVEGLLTSEVISFEDLTSSQSISFKVLLKDKREAFVKLYSDRPTFLSCLHDIPIPGESALLPRERLLMALRLRGQSFFPSEIAHDIDAGIIIQECSTPLAPSSLDAARKYLRAAVRLVQSFDPGPELSPLRNKIQAKLAEHPEPDSPQLEEVDRLVAELHAPLIGGSLRTRRLHPQLELVRIGRFLELNSFLLPKDYIARAQAGVSLLLSARPLLSVPPTFAHGTLKSEHLLSNNAHLLLCDFDHSGYYCGPVDVAHWIWDYFIYSTGDHPGIMLKCLAEELENEVELYLGTCWILAFQLNRDLAFLSRGDFQQLRATLDFLYKLPEAVRNVLSTR